MKLNVIEIFASIQGEGRFSGLPTTFVRLARCNLRCIWCDTTYSFEQGTPHSHEEIIRQVKDNGCPYVCITGGEPLLQKNIYPLICTLCDQGYTVSVETGGSLSIEKIEPRAHVILDVKCPASGMEQKNFWQNLLKIRPQDEIKFVIQDENDYQFAHTVCQKYALYRLRNVLFSPVHNVCDPQQLVHWILRDKLPVRLNLQLHKFIWDPQMRGV